MIFRHERVASSRSCTSSSRGSITRSCMRRRGQGAAAFDAAQTFEVVRHPTSLMLPTPSVGRRAASLLKNRGCDAVWFGAAAPLGLLAPTMRAAGANRIVATTHGHEAGWSQLPVARGLLRRIGNEVDVLTYLGAYTRSASRARSVGFGARPTRAVGTGCRCDEVQTR